MMSNKIYVLQDPKSHLLKVTDRQPRQQSKFVLVKTTIVANTKKFLQQLSSVYKLDRSLEPTTANITRLGKMLSRFSVYDENTNLSQRICRPPNLILDDELVALGRCRPRTQGNTKFIFVYSNYLNKRAWLASGRQWTIRCNRNYSLQSNDHLVYGFRCSSKQHRSQLPPKTVVTYESVLWLQEHMESLLGVKEPYDLRSIMGLHE